MAPPDDQHATLWACVPLVISEQALERGRKKPSNPANNRRPHGDAWAFSEHVHEALSSLRRIRGGRPADGQQMALWLPVGMPRDGGRKKRVIPDVNIASAGQFLGEARIVLSSQGWKGGTFFEKRGRDIRPGFKSLTRRSAVSGPSNPGDTKNMGFAAQPLANSGADHGLEREALGS